MVKLFLRICLLFLAVLPLNGYCYDEPVIKNIFDSAIESYKQGKFEESISSFNKILDSGAESGNIYLNLGNSYFRLGDLSNARLAYERAKKFMPRDKDLDGNIAYLKQKLEENIVLPDDNVIYKIYYCAGALLNLNELSYLVLAIFLLIILLWIIIIATDNKYKSVIACIFLCSFLFLWLLSVLFLKSYNESGNNYGVIMPNEVAVKWGSTDNDKTAFYLHSGTKVIIRQIRGDWMLITIGYDKSGWVKNNQVEVI